MNGGHGRGGGTGTGAGTGRTVSRHWHWHAWKRPGCRLAQVNLFQQGYVAARHAVAFGKRGIALISGLIALLNGCESLLLKLIDLLTQPFILTLQGCDLGHKPFILRMQVGMHVLERTGLGRGDPGKIRYDPLVPDVSYFVNGLALPHHTYNTAVPGCRCGVAMLIRHLSYTL